MKNDIKELEVFNFKSIKNIKFNPKRVNVFIGKPNVGKSNILEALKLLSSTYNSHTARNFFKEHNFLRFNTLYNLFFDEDTTNDILINTDKCDLQLFYNDGNFNFLIKNNDAFWSDFIDVLKDAEFDINYRKDIFNAFQHYIGSEKGTFFGEITAGFKRIINQYRDIYTLPYTASYQPDGYNVETVSLLERLDSKPRYPVKSYSYIEFETYKDNFREYLFPPFGSNLFSMLELNKELQDEIASFLEDQNLEFVLDKKESKFIIQKKLGRIVYQIPYSNIADTLKRVIFYLTAIESNKDSVLIFEEPEVHSYPPYVKMLADRVILNDQNQYFISTHSPYMLNTLIDGLKDDELNVVLTYYEDYQTKIKILSAEELAEVQEWKTDIFFNIDRFINHLQEK